MKIVNIKALRNLIKESNELKTNKSIIAKLNNIYKNYTHSKELHIKFNDFSDYHFGEQAKMIFDDTRTALVRKEFPLIIRSLVNFKVDKNSVLNKQEMSDYIKTLLGYFPDETSKWKLVYLRLSEDQSSAFATLKFFKDNKENYITLIRDIRETKTFYSWKILLPFQENEFLI